jgi:3-oxoisoapionate kinase
VPHPLRLAFYGDDFTGSTDALEVLSFAGLRTALFLQPPTAESLARFGELDAIGVAGDSRAMTPEEMDRHLPAIFEALGALDAPIIHYKVCSTFDSSPAIGSIGRVMDIARGRWPDALLPVVGGTPALGRWCLFGNLFARSGTDGRVYRIDRHPIMSVHPVTPMDEGDLSVHLSRQTSRLAFASLGLDRYGAGIDAVERDLHSLHTSGSDAVVLDAATPEHLTLIGEWLDRQAAKAAPVFVVGPSGVEYALTQWWREREGPTATPDYGSVGAVDPVLAVSGSASRLSAQQVDAAIASGFVEIAMDTAALVDIGRWQAVARTAIASALEALRTGRSVVMHTARGPDDPRIRRSLDVLRATGFSTDRARHEGGRMLGERMGSIVREIIEAFPLERLLVSGGDTSSQVVKALAPQALVVKARLSPGVPLCRMVGGAGGLDGLEVALKGGQMGDAAFFDRARRGSG